ncbi:MAG: hypothetical protein HOE90_05440 [Bacteriovoracaceae bacterium]|nr:hypothetical protein [Bacteriovoracaceae bacterium]
MESVTEFYNGWKKLLELLFEVLKLVAMNGIDNSQALSYAFVPAHRNPRY